MRATGALLAKCVNQYVSVIGTVHSVFPGNMGFNMTTSDQRNVVVNLTMPLNDDVSNSLVEVHGTVAGPAAITCDYYITFPYSLASSYETELDTEAVNLAFNIPSAWK